MAGTLVSWAIIVIIWGQRCRANTQFLFLCALTQTDGCLATSQELIIDPFAKSSFLCWFFHLPPSEYKAIRLDVEDPGDTPDVRWLAVVIMGGAVVTMVRRLHMSPLHLPVLAEAGVQDCTEIPISVCTLWRPAPAAAPAPLHFYWRHQLSAPAFISSIGCPSQDRAEEEFGKSILKLVSIIFLR